jgi:hypothetical protein
MISYIFLLIKSNLINNKDLRVEINSIVRSR